MIQKSKAIKLLGAILLTLFCQKGVAATESATVEPEKGVNARDLLGHALYKRQMSEMTLLECAKMAAEELDADSATLKESLELWNSLRNSSARVAGSALRRQSLVSDAATRFGNIADTTSSLMDAAEEDAGGHMSYAFFATYIGATAMAGGLYVASKMWGGRKTVDLPQGQVALATKYATFAAGATSAIRLSLAYMRKKEFVADVVVPAATGATATTAGTFAASAAAAAGQVALAAQHATFAAGAIPAAFAGAEIASQATSLAQNQLCNVSLAEASPLINHQLRELTDLSDSSSQVALVGEEELLRNHLEYLGVAVKGNKFNLHEFRQAAASRGGGSPIGPEWDLNNFWASSSKSLLLKIHLSKVNARGVKVRFIGSLLGVAAWASLVYGDLLPKGLTNLGALLMALLPLAGLQEKSAGAPAVKKESASSSFWATPKTTKEQKEEEPKKLPIGWLVVALASILAALAAFSKKK